MSSFLTQAQVAGTVGLGAAQGLQRSLAGHPQLCHFSDPSTGTVLLQCDAVLSESHQRELTVSSYPLEDGATIADHVVVPPVELQLQGVISDNPLGDKAGLITEAVATGLTAVVPPLGIAIAGAAYAGYLALNKTERSISAFHQLLYLQGGDPTAQPPVPPRPFDVVTRYQTYRSMVIRSLLVQRDRGTGDCLVFQAGLSQLIVVRPQSASVQVLAAPGLAAARQQLGEKNADENSIYAAGQRGFKAGVGTVDSAAQSASGAASSATSAVNKVAGAFGFKVGG